MRQRGIRRLFDWLSPGDDLANLGPRHTILDVLGGDGLVTRALQRLTPPGSGPTVLTSDIAEGMVAAALRRGLPASHRPRRNAISTKTSCVDGILIAYGAHHIPKGERPIACGEAFRVLKPGGKIVLHDFEDGSPVALWFQRVVHRYSQTGHDFPHFTVEEMAEYLRGVGFQHIQIRYLYDPFLLTGRSPAQARRRLAEHLLDMYGLVKLKDDRTTADALREVYRLAFRTFHYNYEAMGLPSGFGLPRVRVYEAEGRWHAEMPRVAIVGCATKPLNAGGNGGDS